MNKKKLHVVNVPDFQLGRYAITKKTRDREQIMKERRAMIEEVSKNDSDKETETNEEKSAKAKKATTQMIEGTDKVSVADFELLKVLGRGSFGKVMQVEYTMNILR